MHTLDAILASIQTMDQALRDYCSKVLGIDQVLTPRDLATYETSLHFGHIEVEGESDTNDSQIADTSQDTEAPQPVQSNIEVQGPTDRLIFVIQESSKDSFINSEAHKLLSKMIVAMKEDESSVGLVMCKGAFDQSMEIEPGQEFRVVFGLDPKGEIPAHQFVKKGSSRWLFTHDLQSLLKESGLKKQTWADLQMVMKELMS